MTEEKWEHTMPACIDGHGHILLRRHRRRVPPVFHCAGRWASFPDSRGTSVQYPREIFSVAAGSGDPPGPVLQSADGRARLHVFTRPNERGASPAEFIRRAVTDQRQRLAVQARDQPLSRVLGRGRRPDPLPALQLRARQPSIVSTCAIRGREACLGCAGDADELFAEAAVESAYVPRPRLAVMTRGSFLFFFARFRAAAAGASPRAPWRRGGAPRRLLDRARRSSATRWSCAMRSDCSIAEKCAVRWQGTARGTVNATALSFTPRHSSTGLPVIALT